MFATIAYVLAICAGLATLWRGWRAITHQEVTIRNKKYRGKDAMTAGIFSLLFGLWVLAAVAILIVTNSTLIVVLGTVLFVLVAPLLSSTIANAQYKK